MNSINLYLLLVIIFMLIGFAIGVVVHALSQKKIKFDALITTLFAIMGGLLAGLGFQYLVIGNQSIISRESLVAAVVGGLMFAIFSRFLIRDREEIRTSSTHWR